MAINLHQIINTLVEHKNHLPEQILHIGTDVDGIVRVHLSTEVFHNFYIVDREMCINSKLMRYSDSEGLYHRYEFFINFSGIYVF